ncbi:hypothetical protein BDP27DRAFT_1322814 [Rhodocollybia butyracea]|uniref:Uncharacterized protein n=1 Tax=Rhodocollybia butyracea TaxID=206335 RepID=A0A9P5PW96_9AGAR|nr:hypothetical protein BDP27DRAFT_1322814 [Rhodocollybia butyracea]
MPFIRNEISYTTFRNAQPENANTQIDLMAPTLPLPQVAVHPTQISSQAIALITLTAILILISGAAIIRVVHLAYIKKDASRSISIPKNFTESSSSLPLTIASTPQFSTTSNDPYFPDEKIERDITFSFPFAHPVSPPASPKRMPTFLREEEEDISAMLSIRAGEQSVSRRGHKEKKESESSTTTATTVSDSLCPSLQRSSVTSVYSLSIIESEDEEEEVEVEVYEVKRAQTQSMEVKRGVLMSWRGSRPPSPIPAVLISKSISNTEGFRNSAFLSDDSLLQAIPSLWVTHPTDISLVSASSSISVDLDEFPLPPTLPVLSKPNFDLPLLLIIPEVDGPVVHTSREEKRSTVERVITMYE